MSRASKQLGLYLGLLALGGVAGLSAGEYFQDDSRPKVNLSPVQPIQLPDASSRPTNPPLENSSFIARAAQTVGPAVVRLDSARIVSQKEQEPFYRRFFGEESPPDRRRVREGTGSGFIFSSDGLVLTNAHVVEDADEVKVTLKDGRKFDGVVVGADPVTDVAVIKLPTNNLPTVTLGSSEAIIPGDWAIAIGNPLGLNNTVTVGIISAIGRSSSQVGIPDKRVSFIQTDAAINPGNSGGPLLNAQGEVIGVNTAIRANAEGLGFAIPIELASRIANQLVTEGEAAHPYLGIRMITLTPDLRKEINNSSRFDLSVEAKQGVLVVEVVNNSPADRAGFQEGDIILNVGGNAVQTGTDVQQAVELSAIGEDLAVKVNRDGEEKTLTVRPGKFPVDN
ncbi:HtrA2 peptidase [Halothece sp. PCC 7418]|uniref:HhoA/HhoB/HtrA family serine endopeptidase n=1 Tax=Halothece sp. (strain PCC 7418) TaxID=65093 RepID=UPI0002A08997|nr:HhoA/HhoB/HtrA family serine endopeptidase [Halothece sp. PCC 7418]AFZ44507.1 HtrA2 peptidase [Halothece sp. PCC 7418]